MKKLFLFLLISTSSAYGQQMCGGFENPLDTPVTTELEHIFCADLFFCTDTINQMAEAIIQGLNREAILRERIVKLKRKLRNGRKNRKSSLT